MEEFLSYSTPLSDRRKKKYAVVVFLPHSLTGMISPLREQYDPLYNLVAPHITVVFPFETNLPLDEMTSLLKAETDKRMSFLIQMDTVGDFYPDSPIIYWNVKENAQLSELYYRLHASLGIPIPYKHFVPHVTVAREISHHRVIIVKEKIASYLADEKFYAGSVDLIAPLVDEKWVSVRTFPFKGFSANPPAV
jgi:2'-5' RNA ligase